MWAWNGFWRLSNSRPMGFNGVLRIPLSEIEAYTRLQGFDYAKRNEFMLYVERMDQKFMEHIDLLRDIEEKKQRSKEKGARGNRRRR